MTVTDKLVKSVYKTYNYTHPVKGLVGVPTSKSLLSMDYSKLDKDKITPSLKVKMFFASLLSEKTIQESLATRDRPLSKKEEKESQTTTATASDLSPKQTISEQFIERHNVDKTKFSQLAKDIDLKLVEIDGVPYFSFCNFDADEFYTTDKLMNTIYKSRLLSKKKVKLLRNYSVQNNLDLYLPQYYYSSYKLYAEHAFNESKVLSTTTRTTTIFNAEDTNNSTKNENNTINTNNDTNSTKN